MSDVHLVFGFDWSVVSDHQGALLRGLLLTIEIALVGFAIAVALGLPVALARLSVSPLLRTPATAWVGLSRGVPLLIVIYWLYYAAAERGLFSLQAFLAGALSLGLTGSGYMAEIYRSAFLAVPAGQRERPPPSACRAAPRSASPSRPRRCGRRSRRR